MEFATAIAVVSAATAVRWAVGLGGYSGENTPPMHGDFEAQRHWMELTYHLPSSEWYRNGTHNNLSYWGLDYPPVTAYGSWVCGAVAHAINPDWVALGASHGHEGPGIKLFMRATVLAADYLIYIPAVWYYVRGSADERGRRAAAALLLLMQPGLIIVDHGHFQYNNVSLGLVLAAIQATTSGSDLLGAVFFVLSLNYKQMSLYYALPFFAYMLAKALRRGSLAGTAWQVAKLGLVVIATFALCWAPFRSAEQATAVVERLFPFQRGLFEDKVANFWCVVDVVVKLRRLLPIPTLALISLGVTLLACLPSCINLMLGPTALRFKYTLANCALAFFMFSFQVHEKTILLPALPVMLLLEADGLIAVWFQLVAAFSMTPLLAKDGQLTAYMACTVLFFVLATVAPWSSLPNVWGQQPTWVILLFALSVAGMCAIHIAETAVEPPANLPHIFPLMICGYSFLHYAGFFIYFHLRQFATPRVDEVAVFKARQKTE